MRFFDWLFQFSPEYHRLHAQAEFQRDRLADAADRLDDVRAQRDEARDSHRAALEQMSQMVRDGFRAPFSGRKEIPTGPALVLSDDEQTVREAIARRVSLGSELGKSMLADAQKRLARGEESAEEIAGSILDGADLDEPGLDLDLDDEEPEPTPEDEE